MRLLLASAAFLVLASAACGSRAPAEPLRLDHGQLTVDNRSDQEWTNVEIWLNQYFRVTTASIPPKGRFQANVNSFVSGWGQRFDFNHMQIRDLRLKATLPDGKPLEIQKQFSEGALNDALGGAVGGKR
jgi:hypothetical protein